MKVNHIPPRQWLTLTYKLTTPDVNKVDTKMEHEKPLTIWETKHEDKAKS